MERIGKGLPSGNLLQFAIENGPVEIVDLPIKNGWIFYSYVSLPEGTFNVSGSNSKVPMVFKWECSILSKLIRR